MEKYFVFMKNKKTGEEVVASGWKLEALEKWIKFHEKLDYEITKKNFNFYKKGKI